MIGRSAAVEQLTRAVTKARAGPVGALLVGAAGIGKTTLVSEATEIADGFQLLRATGIQLDAEWPFGALRTLFRPLRGDIDGVAPAAREALTDAGRADAPQPDEFAVAGAVLATLSVAAERAPVLIALDDAQWIDQATLRSLLLAFRRLEDEPVMLVLAGRHELLERADFERLGFRRISIDPLTRAESVELARRLGAGEAADAIGVQRVAELSGGVPLAVRELARARATDSLAAPVPEPVPSLVRRLFGARVIELSRPEREAALIAALDHESELQAFVDAAALRDVGSDAWGSLERASVLRIEHGRAMFNHPLVREAVIAQARPPELRAAHLALADALSGRGAEDHALLHRAAGTLIADDDLAGQLERSAEDHRTRSGYLRAAQTLHHAARLSGNVHDRARRLLAAADSARRAGRDVWAEQLAVEARTASPSQDVLARADFLQAHVEARRGSMQAAYRRYLRVAEQVGARDPDLAALSLTYAASAAVVRGDLRAAIGAASAAGEYAPISEETSLSVSETLGTVLTLSGERSRARPLLERVAAFYESRRVRAGAEYVAGTLIWIGEFGRAGALLDDIIGDARQLRASGLLIQALVLRAELGYRTGAWAAALADGTEAVRLAEDTGDEAPLAYALATIAGLEAATGQVDTARASADRARQIARGHGLVIVEEQASAALGALELAAGRPELALVELEPLAAAAAQTGRVEPAVALWPPDLIESLVALDRTSDAMLALDRLEDQARQTGGGWARGVVQRYRGLLTDGADSDVAFEQALEYHRQSAMPFELARTQLCHGQRLRRDGRRVAARGELLAAWSTFRQLRATLWARKAEQELESSGAVLRQVTVDNRDQLTPQERQIAGVIASGATNREAAAELFLSPKTIETHLTRIYRKLGVRSRSQLALLMTG